MLVDAGLLVWIQFNLVLIWFWFKSGLDLICANPV